MFNQYPYLNLNDLNLDFLLNEIKSMYNEVTNFVSINAIKYADPIQWNITSQYEKNTVVIDPLTGTAYISVAAVPSGVALTRTEYWTVVFDLGSFVTRAAQNFTSHWESDTTTTATFPTSIGGWLVWGDVLYKALTNITAGDSYVVGGNIEHFTIEDLYNTYLNTIAQILGMVGNLVDLNTTDKTSIVAAINELVSKDVTLQDAISDEVQARSDADTDIYNQLSKLKTNYHYFEEFGAVGDGVTDDTSAINTALASGYTAFKLLANKTYLVSDNLYIVNSNTHITGEENATVKCADNSYTNMFSLFTVQPTLNLSNIEFDNFTINGNSENNVDVGDPDSAGNLPKNYGGRVLALINLTSVSHANIHNMRIVNAWNCGVWLSDCPYSTVHDNYFERCRVHSISIRNNVSYSLQVPANIIVSGNVIKYSVVGIEIIFGAYNVIVSGNEINNCYDSVKFPSYAFGGTYPNIYPLDTRFNRPSDSGYITAAQQGDGAGIESTGAYTDPTAPKDTSLVYSNNTIVLCEMGARVEELSNDVSIIGNNLRQNNTAGVFIFSATKVSIVGNVCNYNSSDGIRIYNYSGLNVIPCNISIVGNEISGNTSCGLRFTTDGIVINGNQFNDNPLAIYAHATSKNILITSNMFFDYYGAGNLRGIDISNFDISRTRIALNDFNIATPIVGLARNKMYAFDNNIKLNTKSHGVASITDSGTLAVTVPISFPYAPDTGEIQLTPLELGLELSISNITNTSFKVTANQLGSFNWSVDFNKSY